MGPVACARAAEMRSSTEAGAGSTACRRSIIQRQGIAALGELERHRRHGGCCPVLDGQGEIVTVAAEVEVRVAPGVEFRGAAQGLAGAGAARALLGVVNHGDGHAVAALHLAQIGEQRRHLTGGVLVDAMEAHDRDFRRLVQKWSAGAPSAATGE